MRRGVVKRAVKKTGGDAIRVASTAMMAGKAFLGKLNMKRKQTISKNASAAMDAVRQEWLMSASSKKDRSEGGRLAGLAEEAGEEDAEAESVTTAYRGLVWADKPPPRRVARA